MLKLYSLSGAEKRYWETWEEAPGTHVIHWGVLGTEGNSRRLKSTFFGNALKQLEHEIDGVIRDGFAPLEPEEHAVLMVEYKVDGFGTPSDLEKRHRLEDRMNELLGWTGLGQCDGGSIGSGSMEVCSLVADFEIAKQVVEADLAGTEFADYSRIYQEN